MKPPIKPSKPSKNNQHPSTTERVELYVMWKNNSDPSTFKLLTEEEFDAKDADGYRLWERELSIYNGETISYYDVLKIKKILGDQVKDFVLETSVDRDGYFEFTTVCYHKEKDESQYKKELEVFENRFKKYESDLEKYNQENTKYELFKKEQKRNKLKAELAKL